MKINEQSTQKQYVQDNERKYAAYTKKQVSKTNQLSVQKMKQFLAENMIKKSTSAANLASLMFNPSMMQSQIQMRSNFNNNNNNNKEVTQQKNHTDSKWIAKKQTEVVKQQRSPHKNSYHSYRALVSAQNNMDIQQKRKRIYGMPYILQNSQSMSMNMNMNRMPTTMAQQIKLIAVPQLQLSSPVSNFSYKKMYTQSISTTSSAKQNRQMRINDFQKGKILGYGKFGHVYMAKHKNSGFMCALKQIKRQGLDQILQNQLVREIKIQMFLNHPNIVKLYTFFSDKTHIYLVLQLCSSGQLYNFLKYQKHQPVKQELAKVIIRQIVQGIDYIHENHIIHRDLKPENILYHNSMMKICDFGWSIATPLMRETFCGTPLYVSPELLKRNCYNNKVDIWSLGILAYQILVGQVPFQIFCEADYIKILKNQVKYPKYMQISDQAKDFISSCLDKDPEKRMSSSQLLDHPFLKKVELISFPQIH